MPILNPQQAFGLIKYQSREVDLVSFLKCLLPIASKNAFLNPKLVEIHQKFIRFILQNPKKIIYSLGCNTNDINFLQLGSKNIYEILFDVITLKNEAVSKNEGKTTNSFESIDLSILSTSFSKQIENDKIDFPDEKTFFFIPYAIDNIKCYISNQSQAVITYDIVRRSKITLSDIFLINLTAFLLAASGHSIVFCIYQEEDFEGFNLFDKINFQFFSETHIFVEFRYVPICSYKLDFLRKNLSEIGYIYFYIHSKRYDPIFLNALSNCNNLYIKVFQLSKEISEIFQYYDIILEKKKKFCPIINDVSGFMKKNLGINLCNVPIYESKDQQNDLTPLKISGPGYGEISADLFRHFNHQRVPITIDDDDFFVDFSDLHIMNPELYVAEPMYLSKQDLSISLVEKVKDNYMKDSKFFDKLKAKSKNIKLNTYEKMLLAFHYLHSFTIDDNGEKIRPYTSQIYAVYQAISSLQNIGENNKGVILQVHTGEGKSFIVQALAEHLARQGNTVHIATSNIILAARDFQKSYNYFRLTEQKYKNKVQKHFRPSILIHDNELQFVDEFLQENKLVDSNEYRSFYSKENFNNSVKMNISVCLNNKSVKSNIVFSTFLNFETFYLNQSEKNTAYVGDYMNNCYLIIDEADSILIDEITNGTILSKPMNSNAPEVLEFIYKQYISGCKDPNTIKNLMKLNFPECKDITIEDINGIFSDIEKVHEVDDSKKISYCIIPGDDNDKKSTKIINPMKICPFDSKHKGIIEKNKEFSGFIHQLIGIKEKIENPKINKDLVIQPLSMNYSFISHPTYVMKYKGVCGVTGTIGTEKDQRLIEKFYNLRIQKVPRHQMSLRNDLPAILCQDINERNYMICQEVANLHSKMFPVLVVFKDYTEIDTIKDILEKDYGIKNIAIFDGKTNENNESVKNELEKESGYPGAVTSGTNFCGRGISIVYHGKPLFVIVSYYNEDNRSINQVLGRSGRNGAPGITRIICTREMFDSVSEKPSEQMMRTILHEYSIKNILQVNLINTIKKYHPWIFDETQYTTRMDRKVASKIRKSQINVNRITAYKCKFPICMGLGTFFDIQTQRIFSIKNCPECKYTWNLFRIYMRELIYESWSIFVNSVDRDYNIMINQDYKFKGEDYSYIPKDKLYTKFFNSQYRTYCELLFKFIYNEEGHNVVDSFLKIHNIVIRNYEKLILSTIPESVRKLSTEKGKKDSRTSFRIGFFPMNLAENSGIKITPLNDDEEKKANKGQLYIIDPELKYLKKGMKGRFSITNLIDGLFQTFQEVVDEKLQGLFGVRFFLRRTLGGCEFGICVVPPYEPDDDIENDELINCIVDRKILIMLTICTKSTVFWIAGILMIVLVFVISVSVMIATKFLSIKQIGKKAYDILKKGFKKIAFGISDDDDDDDDEESKGIIGKLLNGAFELIVEKLKQMILDNIKQNDLGFSILFEAILNMFVPMETGDFDEKLSEKLFSHFKISDEAKGYFKGLSPFGKLLKIGILFVVLIATFVMNFKHKIRLTFEKFTKDTSNNYKVEQKEYSMFHGLESQKCHSYFDTKNFVKKEMDDDFFDYKD